MQRGYRLVRTRQVEQSAVLNYNTLSAPRAYALIPAKGFREAFFVSRGHDVSAGLCKPKLGIIQPGALEANDWRLNS